MGAPTSLTKWTSEDDLSLKNAVEAGASLESLAKGAVQFSRQFTIHQLRDRWHSLLYDLDTSTEASAQIVEIEIELAASNLLKANRACNPNSKGKESSSGKRKADSVRSHYYAMGKRIHSEPCAVNPSFHEPSALLASTGCDNGSMDQLKPQSKPPADDFALEVPFSDDHGHEDTGYGSGQHAFTELMRVDSSAANGNVSHQSYHAEHVDSVEDEIPDGTHEGCLFGYPGSISSAPRDEAECNNKNQSFEDTFQQRDFPNILGENLFDTSADVHEISQLNALARSSPYKKENAEARPLSGFDSSNTNGEFPCSDFVRNDNSSPHIPDYGGILPGYLSLPSGMPIWRTMEDTSTPSMPMNGHYGDKDQGLLNVDDHKTIDAPGCDVGSSEQLNDAVCDTGLNYQSFTPENDFMNFPDSYMDFSLLFNNLNEKHNTDRSCLGLSSILLNSPSDTHHGVANSNDLGATNVLETCLVIPDAECSKEPNVLCDQMHSGLHNNHNTSFSGINMPSTSSQTSNTAELQEEFLNCALNEQDLEIPNNDHVILPDQEFLPFSSNSEQRSRGITGLVSSDNVLCTDGRDPVGDLNKVKERVANVQPTVTSLKESSSSFPKVGMLLSCDGCAVKTEPSKYSSIAGGSRFAGSGIDEPTPCKSATVGLSSTPVTALKEESAALCFQNQDKPDAAFASFLENHLQEIDNVTDSYSEEATMQVGVQACLPPHPDLVSAEVGFSDTIAIMPTSDQEEQFSDNEDDVPYFSDIEALILDMDLGPYDAESCLLSKEVSRYQQINTKNTIRGEQGFHSQTNRSISSHGAFAVFYGRHLKYFIKNPEVSIGRDTKDVKVDIDLGREGRTHKISRRQASIKMDEEGAFSLKNIGKFSIFVNGKEVPARKRINLLSHSLIEIQGMHFAFEANESAVSHYVKTKNPMKQNQRTEPIMSAWSPDLNP